MVPSILGYEKTSCFVPSIPTSATTLCQQEVSKKTKELINNVKGLAPESGKISLELLHKRKMNPATETFLFTLASVEGLTEL